MSFKNKNIIRQFPFFTHFACIPFIQSTERQLLERTQQIIEQKFIAYGLKVQQMLKRHSHLLGHLTFFMLTLRREDTKAAVKQLMQKEKEEIIQKLTGLQIYPTKISYFTRVNKSQKCNQLTVIYMEIDQKSAQTLSLVVDYLVRILLKHEIIVAEELKYMRIIYNHKTNIFQLETFHVSLFRCRGLMERGDLEKMFEEINASFEKNIKNKEEKARFSCNMLDISTMLQFDETEFYEPFLRIKFG